jgi:enoyl-CoA hydratase/carnithine racemase
VAYEYIRVEQKDALTIVTIARPRAYNALNTAAHEELSAAFDIFEADDRQWVAIITGEGEKAFCAGHDLKQQASGSGIVLPASGFGGLTTRFSLTKPVIAAVNGVAMGGGFEIVLASDIVVAAENAQFALPEPKVGLAALGGGMQRLPVQIGLKRAMGLMLTGRSVSAQEGVELGFVNEAVPVGEALTAARRWAEEILSCSPLSIRATKKIALQAMNAPLDQLITDVWSDPSVRTMLASQDAAEGAAAFVARRPPRWTGQ